jgi:hypothetical protein
MTGGAAIAFSGGGGGGGGGGSSTDTPAPVASKLFFQSQPQPNAVAGGSLGTIEIVIQDAQGSRVATANHLIRITIASGPTGAIVTGTQTEKSAFEGSVTFAGGEVTLERVGEYRLRAEAPNNPAIAAVDSDVTIVVSHDAAHEVRWPPASSVAGNQSARATLRLAGGGSIMLELLDRFGNRVTSPAAQKTVTATFAASPSGGAFYIASDGSTRDSRSTVSAGGFATFGDLAVDRTGTYRLRFEERSFTTAAAESNTFTVLDLPEGKWDDPSLRWDEVKWGQ